MHLVHRKTAHHDSRTIAVTGLCRFHGPMPFRETEVFLRRRLFAEDTLRFGEATGSLGHCLNAFLTAIEISFSMTVVGVFSGTVLPSIIWYSSLTTVCIVPR